MNIFTGKRVPLDEDQFIDFDSAQFYDEHARRFMGPVYRRFAVKAAGIITSGNRVLDIGAGSGLPAIELAQARSDWRITGIDVSENMLELARRNAAQSGLADRIEFRQATADALPFDEGCFSLVVSNASLHLWKDPLKVFKEIARVTAPGGYCLIWDNLRLSAFGLFMGLIGRAMGMDAPQRRLWRRAVRSSYTAGEAKAMLKESALQNARVTLNPWIMELGIEWRKLRTWHLDTDIRE
jgi:SAM-dependent methyltransferase